MTGAQLSGCRRPAARHWDNVKRDLQNSRKPLAYARGSVTAVRGAAFGQAKACPTMRCAQALSGQLSAFERHEIVAACKEYRGIVIHEVLNK
jgi:hypothetical protein